MKTKKPGNLRRELQKAHREIEGILTGVISRLQAQSNSTFGDGQSWDKAGLAGFGNHLIAYGNRLVSLGETFNTGKPPQWWLDQQAAYAKSAIGQLRRKATDDTI